MIHIAVVGAGIAGLNAALTLQDAGISCSIKEKSWLCPPLVVRMFSNREDCQPGTFCISHCIVL
jgi:predicted NAD/FAD-dependent oxidoreductase